MRRLLISLCLLTGFCLTPAQRLSLDFEGTSLAEALRQIDHAQQEKHLIFVFNDLEELSVTQSLHRCYAIDAVRQVCQGYPVLVTEDEENIFIEYIKPPMLLLPDISVTGRQIEHDDAGYLISPNVSGLGASQLLTTLPDITLCDGQLCLNGQPVKHIYLNGLPIKDPSEISQLTSDVIRQVRTDYQTQSLYITLRQPAQRGHYGFIHLKHDRGSDNRDTDYSDAIFFRRGNTDLYNKTDYRNNERQNYIRQESKTPESEHRFSNQLKDENLHFSNRVSVMHAFTPKQQLGFSYYIAANRHDSKETLPDLLNYEAFDGSNRHIDNEFTLKYSADLTPQRLQLDLLADYYIRTSTSHNVSLYGSGVGTEMNEAPSIQMWKFSLNAQQSLRPHLSLRYGADISGFLLHYAPNDHLTNTKGIDSYRYELNQQGLMSRLYGELCLSWANRRLNLGLTHQYHHTGQHIFDDYANRLRDEEKSLSQTAFSPYLRLLLPLDDEHQHYLTFSLQREMDEIPYALISPTVSWSDAYNYSVGNQRLKAPTNSGVTCQVSLWQSRWIITTSYRDVKDEIHWMTERNRSNSFNLFYTRPFNLRHMHHLGLQSEVSLQPLPWWRVKLNAQWDLRIEEGEIGTQKYDGRHLQQYYICSNHLEWGRHWSALLNGCYQPAYRTLDRHYQASYTLRAEIMKGFLNNRLQCALTGQPLHRFKNVDRIGDDFRHSIEYNNSLQAIGLRIVWNFRNRTHIRVNTVEGGQTYNERKEE